MKFSHKIVAASAVLLLVTVSLLTTRQYFNMHSEMRTQVGASVEEIVNGVRNTVGSKTQ